VPARSPTPIAPSEAANTYATQNHDDRDLLELVDSSDDALLASMNEQRQKGDVWPWLGAFLGVVFLIWWKNTNLPGLVYLLGATFGAMLTYWLSWREDLDKLTVLFFEPDAQTTSSFEKLILGLDEVARLNRMEAQTSTSRYVDTRYTAGAGSGVSLVPALAHLGQGPGVRANIDVPVLRSAATTLAFYPDRVLAFQKKGVAAFSYDDLAAKLTSTRFVERRNVVADAVVVGQTWQYVNKNGSPDRRFKNNRQIPVCQYGEMHISTPHGLDLRFMGSKEHGFNSFAAALTGMKAALTPKRIIGSIV
jgi:hypothetical protein